MKYEGENSFTRIGNHTVIRESVTINAGTKGGGMETRIGNHCFIMASAHIGHDCILGDNVILANAVLLAGHCELGDYAFMGGNSVMQQYLKMGENSFLAGGSGLGGHVPPFVSAFGYPATWTGLNVIGLSRRGFEDATIKNLRKFYKRLFSMEGEMRVRIEKIEKEFSGKEVEQAIEFIKCCFETRHAMVQPRRA